MTIIVEVVSNSFLIPYNFKVIAITSSSYYSLLHSITNNLLVASFKEVVVVIPSFNYKDLCSIKQEVVKNQDYKHFNFGFS